MATKDPMFLNPMEFSQMINVHGTEMLFPLRTLAYLLAVGLPLVLGCGSGRNAEPASSAATSSKKDEDDPTYQEGYQYASSILQSAANAPAQQKRDIMKQLEPDSVGKKPRAFLRGCAEAMKDFEVRMANEALR